MEKINKILLASMLQQQRLHYSPIKPLKTTEPQRQEVTTHDANTRQEMQCKRFRIRILQVRWIMINTKKEMIK